MQVSIVRRFGVAAFVALLLPLAASTARAADPTPLNLLLIPTDSSAQAFYAQDLGYFKAAGLDVKITSMGSSPAIISALASGAADIGNSVVGSAVSAREHGIDVRFIAPAGLYLASSPTARLMTAKDSPLRNAADLTGKTVAVTGLADLTYYATLAWLDQKGGTASGVKFVELKLPEMAPALAAHRVDAAVLIEPFVTANGGELRTLATVDDFVAKRFLATGWLVSDAWLQSHADVARRFAAVMKQTAEWANGHRKESAEILLHYTKLSPETAAKMNRATYGVELETATMQPVIDSTQKYGDLKRAMSASELMWSPDAPAKR